MENLISSLTNGTVEYREGGECIRHPPNAVMLRAARTLAQLFAMIEGSNRTIETMSRALLARDEEIIKLKQEIENATIGIVRPASTDESVLQSEGGTSDVGSTNDEPDGSHLDSARGTQ